ncbi:GPW/gp25 family protein [Rhizobium ruizarguesonis]|uniref:GPW/gp25 family protein n=1 Tax=Rhizobium ruizarguesonis TaxID=2081791 RepID=UPI00163A215B|nr:GPW/gp25 family protein [Rhizobium ruizarguesonis]MBC2802378.1 GPW/gp25 family protein [Rhizobium ruizarguesonis]
MSDFLGKGPQFPFRSRGAAESALFSAMSDGEEKIRQSVQLILATAPGERVMRPDFGCGVHELLFEPLTSGLTALVTDRVNTCLARWEPRIDILKVDVRPDDDEPRLLVHITYRIRANNAVNNVVYPFYLQEGAA